MICLIVKAKIPNAHAQDAISFFINCTNEKYSKWWKNTHIEFHTIKRTDNVIGSIVFFDEYVGRKRLKFKSVITRYDPQREIEYRMIKWGVKLPAWLHLNFMQHGQDVAVTHTLKIGFTGWLKVSDCVVRPFISKGFINDLEQHAKEEFNELSKQL